MTHEKKYDKDYQLKTVIEIADYLFKNPDKKMSDVLSYFTEKCRKNRRTVERYLAHAKTYNNQRLYAKEKAKQDMLLAKTKKEVQKAIISREKIISELVADFNRLSEIVAGSGYMAKDKTTGQTIGYMQASYSDEIRAKTARKEIAKQLSDIEGYNAAIKIAETDSSGNDIIKDINVNIRKYDD
jgi:hypothetical protein